MLDARFLDRWWSKEKSSIDFPEGERVARIRPSAPFLSRAAASR